MTRKQKVVAGQFYVDHSRKIMREVVKVSDQTVVFITHHMETGNSCGSVSECKIPDFLQWVHHEASSAEMTSLLYRKKEILFDSSPYSMWDEVSIDAQLPRVE